jgi:hypothetical protein
MMRLMLLAGSAIALLTTGSMAAETCIPVAPARWDGQIQLPGSWLSGTTFLNNGCSFGGADELNGIDAWTVDITGHEGLTLNVTTTDSGPLGKGVSGFFLNEKCEKGGFWGFTQNKAPYPVPAPEGAKWLFVTSEYGAGTVTVVAESAGRTCEAPAPVKKKKKKRRR